MKLIILAISLLLITACSSGLTQDDIDQAVADALTSEQEEKPEPKPEPDPEPEPEPEPEPAPEPEPEPSDNAFSYGDDPYFDALQDTCAAGDTDACFDLFWESPLDSDYEAFGLDNMYGPDPFDDLAFDDSDFEFDGDYSGLYDITFQMTWDDMSSRERSEVCEGYNLLGHELMYEFFTEGWYEDGDGLPAPSMSQFRSFFDSVC